LVLPQLAELLSKLSILICPVVHIVYLRIVRSTNVILSTYTDEVYHSCDISQAFVIGECRVILGSVLTYVLNKDILPFESVTCREAMTDLVFLSIEYEAHSQVIEGRFSMFVLLLLHYFYNPFTYAFHHHHPYHHHHLQVREGVLLGCSKAVDFTGFF
jgi:hypothetical protein